MKAKEEIIKKIQSLSGKYSPYNIFYDWVQCSALAIQNSCTFRNETWQKREEQYLSAIQKYGTAQQKTLTEMFNLLGEALEENIEDALGDIYMKSGCYNKSLGQFFTPFHLANLMGDLEAKGIIEEIERGRVPTILEPSTGGGANIIGLAKALQERGYNYQQCIQVTAQDLDWLAVYMSYVQFSLLGIDAVVVQGDSLLDPYNGRYPQERTFYTPKRMGVLL